MTTFIGLLNFALFVALIVGLIKPELILRKTETPTRKKIFLYWLLGTIFLFTLSALTESKSSSEIIKEAKSDIEKENYENAISELNAIEKEDSLYSQAQNLITLADSLSKMTDEEKEIAKKAEEERIAKEEKTNQKEQLKRELESINKGVDFSTYRGAIESLQMEIILFGTWAKIIKDGEASDDKDIQLLAKNLKTKVSNIQTKEFPILRKEYGKLLKNKLWENDIEVYTNGSGNKNLNFTGTIFAANKNIKDFQTELYEGLTMFRFKQSRYKWLEADDEYTYYTIFEGKDSELVTFE